LSFATPTPRLLAPCSITDSVPRNSARLVGANTIWSASMRLRALSGNVRSKKPYHRCMTGVVRTIHEAMRAFRFQSILPAHPFSSFWHVRSPRPTIVTAVQTLVTCKEPELYGSKHVERRQPADHVVTRLTVESAV
jgi:hypothetical protein